MGKGNGEYPPRQFIGDQYFCEVFIFAFMAAGITLSGFSVGMDDGGTFPYQYFFTGFILGPILLVNLIARMYVVNAVEKKGLTRKNIIEVLSKSVIGRIIWPLSCRVGMMWCIPGTFLTALGGVNCAIEKHANGTRKVRNDCYFDIEGEHGEMYKSFAIALTVVHVASFVYLLLSNCPVHSVYERIKEDPKPARRPYTNTQPSASASTPTSTSTTTGGASNNNIDLVAKIERLEYRIREMENRDTGHVRATNVSTIAIAPPPPYSQLMEASNDKNNSACHV